ncbi:hypothetical protein TYRP_009634 [Tyrophagus putrescentiae]|nr:hypothetical protein TYRP_009634 [Tyrophagus putrescentiae]
MHIAQICYFLIAYAFITIVVRSYDTSVHPWYSIVYAHLEAHFGIFGLLQMVQSSAFFVGCTLLGTLVYAGHVKEVNRAVQASLALNRCSNLGAKPVFHYTRTTSSLLNRQLNEHNRVCYLVMRGCAELFGNVLLCFLLTHLPTNVYLLQRNVFAAPPLFTLLLFWLIIFFQALAAFVVFAPLAWVQTVFHSPRRFIPRLQMLMSGKRRWQLCYKLKYDDLLNRLLHGPKMALTIGTLQPITFYSALEFLFLYLGYVLMGISQMIQANLDKFAGK